MKRILSLVLAMCMMFTACSTEKSGIFKAGTYEGTAEGFGGDVTMSVTVDENKIVSIEAVAHNESTGISDPAFNNLVEDIITYQTVALDAVAGEGRETSAGSKSHIFQIAAPDYYRRPDGRRAAQGSFGQ